MPGLVLYDANGKVLYQSGVPSTRSIATTAPISGGGDLSADRTLTFDPTALTNLGAGVADVADLGVIWDASAGALRKVRMDDILYAIHALSAKTTLAANDEFVLLDSAASYAAKRILKSDLVTALGGGGFPTGVYCRAYRTTYLSVSGSTFTVITFDSESSDSNSMHSTSSSRITVPNTGVYFFAHCGGGISYGIPTYRSCHLYKNGSRLTDYQCQVGSSSAPDMTSFSFEGCIALTAGDYLEIALWANAAFGLNSNGYDNGAGQFGGYASFSVVQIGG